MAAPARMPASLSTGMSTPPSTGDSFVSTGLGTLLMSVIFLSKSDGDEVDEQGEGRAVIYLRCPIDRSTQHFALAELSCATPKARSFSLPTSRWALCPASRHVSRACSQPWKTHPEQLPVDWTSTDNPSDRPANGRSKVRGGSHQWRKLAPPASLVSRYL